jgi:ketose-bisphosphate aldolase
MITNLLTILSGCGNRGLLAFNVQNIYHLYALNEFVTSNKIPAIAQFSERYVLLFDKLYGLNFLVNKYKHYPLFFCLDHCKNFDIIECCVNAGFDSVMYDGSDLPLTENIRNTLEVKKMMQSSNCLIEGEVGRIGGKEDAIVGRGSFVDINDALRYYKATSVNLLALGIGNAHGFYDQNANIDISILDKFQKQLEKPALLVLHGASGIDAELVRDSIKFGVCKINFSTDLKVASNNFNKNYFNGKEIFDESDYMMEYTNLLKIFYSEHIKLYQNS